MLFRSGWKIAQVAKTWVDTPYAPIGSKYSGGNAVKKAGADCSGSVWAIYKEAGYSYGNYFNTVRFVDVVASDPHFIAAWIQKLVSADESFVKGKHFFKEVFMPQVGDICWWPGHMSIYDPASGAAPPHNVLGNAWSERDKGKNFSSVRYQWYDDIFKTPVR